MKIIFKFLHSKQFLVKRHTTHNIDLAHIYKCVLNIFLCVVYVYLQEWKYEQQWDKLTRGILLKPSPHVF
jgi:hypothetical protein